MIKMSFFIRGKSKNAKPLKKRKSPPDVAVPKRKRELVGEDEDIPSDEDENLFGDEDKVNKGYSSDEDTETAQEKRLRLAKQYLAQLEVEESAKREDEDLDSGALSDRLKQDLLEQSGKLQKEIAQCYLPVTEEDIRVLRGHKLPITCVVITPDDKHIFSGSKDCSIIKWDVQTGKKVKVIPRGKKDAQDNPVGHTSHVVCLSISTDGKFLASGDMGKLLQIWDGETCQHLHTFTGHRGPVSGVAFRKDTHQLFSSSHDRTVKIWNIDEMVYVETLFGHQDNLTAIDCLARERAVTSGGRDRTIRVWKVVEESQLVFHGHVGCIDCVALINEGHFISGADDNSIALWSVSKKKPMVTVQNAHNGPTTADSECNASENWVTSVAALQNTDLVASGSNDGCIRLWHCSSNFRSLSLHLTIPIVGFVNSLKFSNEGDFLVAGVGQEHRLGRWWRMKEAKNSICIISLPRTPQEKNVLPKTIRTIPKKKWTIA